MLQWLLLTGPGYALQVTTYIQFLAVDADIPEMSQRLSRPRFRTRLGWRCGVGDAPLARKVHPDPSIATRFEFWRAAFDLHNDHEQLLHREYCIITAGF